MGTDKAALVVRGRPLGVVAADALRDSGAEEVFAVGGQPDRAAALGLTHVADRWPGEGPLGAIITALGAAHEDTIVVCSCDMPDVTADAVREVVAALGAADDGAVARADGRVHPLLAAYRRQTLPTLRSAFEHGERAVRAALAPLAVAFVDLSVPQWARNVNFPGDLA